MWFAKDIIQELFTNIWVKRAVLEIPNVLAAYLYSAVRNTMLIFIERNQAHHRRIQSIKDFIDQETVMTDHLIREKQLAVLIEKEIEALPTKMRKAFLLSRKENLTYAQIAKELNLSKDTVRSHTKHALKILRLKF